MLVRKFHGRYVIISKQVQKPKAFIRLNLSTQGCTRLLSKKSDIEVERPLSFFLSTLLQPVTAPTKQHAITAIRKRLTNFFITDTIPFYFLRKRQVTIYPCLSTKSTIAAHIIFVDTRIKNRFSTRNHQPKGFNKFSEENQD